MTKRDLIIQIQIARMQSRGLSVRAATASTEGYYRKTLEELGGMLRNERELLELRPRAERATNAAASLSGFARNRDRLVDWLKNQETHVDTVENAIRENLK